MVAGGGGFCVSVYDANLSPFVRDSRALRTLDNLAQYDYILVCIVDDSAASSARAALVAQGAAPSAIRHINVYGYTTEHESRFYDYDNQEILNKLANDSFEAKTFACFLDSHIAQPLPTFCSFEFRRSLRHALHNDAHELESKLIEHYKTQPDRFPIINVAYSLGRSGTTLMTQWLASLQIACYPTNLLKPYFDTPIVGFKTIQAVMQITEPNVKNPYTSDYGETEELFDVTQYRVVREFDILQQPNADSLQTIAAIYRGIMDSFQKPLMQKIQPFEIEILEQCFDNSFYIVLSRDIYAHALAATQLHQRYWNTPGFLHFYRNYAPKNLDFTKEPLAYTAATLKNAIAHRDRLLQNVPESRKIHVSYEDFCRNPKALFEAMLARLAALGYVPTDTTYKGESAFTISPRRPSEEERAIVDSVFANDSYNVVV